MTSLSYDSAVIQISEIQKKFICDVLEKQGFKNGKVTLEPVGKLGDNYVTNVVRIIAENEDNKSFKMVAKVASVHEVIRKMMNLEALFKNEILMYTKVLPKFLELQKNAAVPQNEQIKFATCYGILSEAPNEVIVLEDMKESNFEMLSKFESMPDECIRLALKKLAIIHSMSFVLKNKEPETYEEFKNKLINIWVLMNSSAEGMRFLLETLPNDLLLLLDNEKYKKIFQDVMSQLQRTAEKIIAYNAKSKHSIIQQGDCWNNNIMFKLENGKPLEAVMIDYQLSAEANPAYDFLYFTFNCTDYESKCKYYLEWIDYYHTQLDNSLANFGLKANYLYPRDQFDADLRRLGKLVMGLTFLTSNAFVQGLEDSVDMKSNTGHESNITEETMKAFKVLSLNKKSALKLKNRVEELIDSFVEFGYY